ALCRIYGKYENYLLTLATGLLGDVHAAEDVVHDVFCSFIESRARIKMKGKLKSYLRTCVANRARDRIRALRHQAGVKEAAGCAMLDSSEPSRAAIWSEESRRLSSAVARLPYEQREAIVLHLRGGMRFREIAAMEGISINSIKSRYRYGLERLRSVLNSEEDEK
ncbi:MAG: sigma-70 family RNA polymerase sigma factor, partial [Phycisphaerales bacterium]